MATNLMWLVFDLFVMILAVGHGHLPGSVSVGTLWSGPGVCLFMMFPDQVFGVQCGELLGFWGHRRAGFSHKKEPRPRPGAGALIAFVVYLSQKRDKRQDKTHHTPSSDLQLLFICTKFLYGTYWYNNFTGPGYRYR